MLHRLPLLTAYFSLLTSFLAAPPPPAFTPAVCPFLIPADTRITCGYVTVPEDRAQPNGKTIQIGVAVVHSPHPHPRPDPFMMLNGGPALGLVEDLPLYLSSFRPLLETRDLIFYDQRGAGWSQPRLDCPELNFPLPNYAEHRAAYLTCRDRWLAQGVNLAAYNTAENTADAQAVWQALGYTNINLYGVSYGTILAQHLMRQYPGEIRSVVIDSIYPLGSNLVAEGNLSNGRFFQAFFAECAADALCHAAYPDPEGVFNELFERYHTHPLTLTVEHPITHAPSAFRFDSIAYFAALARTSGRDMPALLYDLQAGDYHTILLYQREILRALAAGKAGANKAAHVSVMCSDGVLNATPEQLATMPPNPQAAVWKQMYTLSVAFALQVCHEWPGGAATPDPAALQPLQSALPILIINGAYEVGAASTAVENLRRNLPNHFFYIVPGVGHGAVLQGGDCTSAILLAFYNDPTRAPDTRCLADLENRTLNTRFTLRAALAQLPVQIGLLALAATLLFLNLQLPITHYRFLSPNLKSLVSNLTFPLLTLALLLLTTFAITQKWLDLPLALLVAWLVPLLAAAHCALAFSPEDDGALEVVLATGRMPAWILLDRAGLALLLHGLVALSASAAIAYLAGESWLTNVVRWLPAWLFLPALALSLTLTLRRAQPALLITALLWFASLLFGDAMVERWPMLWPLHFYLDPTHTEFVLNRWWFLALGLTLLLLAAHRAQDTEHVLFGGSARFFQRRGAERAEKILVGAASPSFSNLQSKGLAQSLVSIPISPLFSLLLTELRLHLRRPSLLILLTALLVTPVLGAVLAGGQFAPLRAALQAGVVSVEYASGRVTAMLIPLAWMSAFAVLLFFLPSVLADVIPRDSQWGVRELLDSTPLGVGRYLAGKIFSIWFLLTVGLAATLLITLAIWSVFVGPVRAEVLVEIWVLGLWPFALVHAALCILLTAAQPNNRRALLTSLGLVVACIALQAVGFLTAPHWLNLFNPTRPALMLHYLFDWPGATTLTSANSLNLLTYFRQAASFSSAMLSHVAGAGLLGVVWVGVWWWLKREK